MLRAATVALIASAAIAQTVHQVGPGGFAQIADAVAAAQSGDVVEIATGAYAPCTIDKSLVLRALPGARVVVLAQMMGVMQFHPPAGETVRVARIEFLNPWPAYLTLRTQVDRGTAWFEDCIFEAPPWLDFGALEVRNATAVLRRCVLVGHRWATNGSGQHNAGLRAVQAHVSATDCSFFGSHTHFDSYGYAGEGVRSESATVHLVDCELSGGAQLHCMASAPGPGLLAIGSSAVTLADCIVRGGAAQCGTGGIGLQNLGQPPVRLARTQRLGGAGPSVGAAEVGTIATVPLLGATGDTLPMQRGQPWSVTYQTEPLWPIGVFFADSLSLNSSPLVGEPLLLPANGATPLALLVADPQGTAVYATTLPAAAPLLGASLFLEAVTGVALPLQTSPPVGGLVW